MSQSKKGKGRDLSTLNIFKSKAKPADHLHLRFLVGGTEETFRIPVTGDMYVDDLKEIVIGKVPTANLKYEFAKVRGILSNIKT